jgi:hypothetical protein
MGGIIIKIILVTTNNIYISLVYLEGHPNNYLIINGEHLIYPTCHFLFTKR